MQKTICFSGHRDNRLPKGENYLALKERTYSAIADAVDDGYTCFIQGACYGFDFLAAMQVIKYREQTGKAIELVSAVPFRAQAQRFSPAMRAQYDYILSCSERVEVLSESYYDGVYLERNRWMADRSQRLICYFDGNYRSGTGSTVRYAEKRGLQIINLY